MITHKLDINVAKAFGNLYRKECVLIAVENGEGKILIGEKPYMFPPTIARLLGGGVDKNEKPDMAAVRELEEELGVAVAADDLLPLVLFETDATDEDGKKYHNDTYVYYVNIHDQKFQAGDDVDKITAITFDELGQLGARFDELPDTLWYKGPENTFCWADYGKLYGPVHKIVAKEVKNLTV